MNSEDRTSDRRPPLPYEQRFVKGKVISHDQGIVHFLLETQVDVTPCPKRARVTLDRMPPGKEALDYTLYSLHRLFLLRPTIKDPNLWYASLTWADPASNPWDDDSPYRPKPGDEVGGTVTALVSTDTAVIVTLDRSRIEAYLHQEETPGRHQGDRIDAHVGDRIRAVVMTVDQERLSVNLSVNKAVDNAGRCFQELRQQVERQHNDADPLVETLPMEQQPFAGLRVLIVEHEREFAKHLIDLLKGLGATAERTDNPQHMAQLLRDKMGFSHILCDYLMGNSELRQELHNLSSRAGVPVALMSGEYTEAQAAAKGRGWAFLPKPIAYVDLYGWLVQGQAPVPTQDESTLSQTWGLGLESKVYLKRAHAAIAAFCQRVQAAGACWVRRQRQGVYAVLAAYNLDERSLSQAGEHFGQSLVYDVIGTDKPIGFSLDRAGPLGEIGLKETANVVVGLPLRWNLEMLPDALIVYIEHAHGSQFGEREVADLARPWEPERDNLAVRLGDLDEMAMLAERLREAESFATMGRVAGAILHEIRQALQPLETYAVLARQRLKRQVPSAEVLDAVDHLAEAATRITELAKTNLYNLQKTRRQIVQLDQRIREIVKWYKPRAQRQDLLLKCELLATPINLNLPPEALEQPLANLLNNAFDHFGKRKWGAIIIRVRFDSNQPKYPVSIEVSDQGEGMTAEQRQSLFTPRVSAKKTLGYGLGLYTSRQLLLAVGGDLECVESWRWLGSTFRIRLPYSVDKIKV